MRFSLSEAVARTRKHAVSAWVALFLLLPAFALPLRAQVDEDLGANARSARLQQMREVVDGLEAFTFSGSAREPVDRVQEPVLRFSDVARGYEDGTLWIWGRKGRPIAMVELYRSIGTDVWAMTMSSLSAAPIRLQSRFGWAWEPRRSGLAFQPLASAPSPAEKEAMRLRQIKELARRFSAHQFWDPNNQRSELRLLPQPAYRYEDVAEGLLDGALLLFCHSTNVELILVIEAVQDGNAAPAWQYALARLGHAEFHVQLDGREIWQAGRIGTVSAMDAYYQVFEPVRAGRRDVP